MRPNCRKRIDNARLWKVPCTYLLPTVSPTGFPAIQQRIEIQSFQFSLMPSRNSIIGVRRTWRAFGFCLSCHICRMRIWRSEAEKMLIGMYRVALYPSCHRRWVIRPKATDISPVLRRSGRRGSPSVMKALMCGLDLDGSLRIVEYSMDHWESTKFSNLSSGLRRSVRNKIVGRGNQRLACCSLMVHHRQGIHSRSAPKLGS